MIERLEKRVPITEAVAKSEAVHAADLRRVATWADAGKNGLLRLSLGEPLNDDIRFLLAGGRRFLQEVQADIDNTVNGVNIVDPTTHPSYDPRPILSRIDVPIENPEATEGERAAALAEAAQGLRQDLFEIATGANADRVGSAIATYRSFGRPYISAAFRASAKVLRRVS